MSDLRGFAEETAQYLGTELQLDAKDTATVRFGLESLLGFLINVAAMFGVAWWLGITSYVLAAWLPSILLRLVSGGVHSSTYLRCLVLGSTVLIGSGQVATMLLLPQSLQFSLIGLLAVGGCYAIQKWAPADTPAKPIISSVKRARYRKLSYIYMAIWTAVMSVLTFWSETASGFALASIGGIGWQIFSITPSGYRFVAIIEKLTDKAIVLFRQ